MTTGDIHHIILFLVTVVFLVLSSFAVSKMPRKWQNAMFIIAAVLGSAGVFFRYAMNCSFAEGIRIDTLLIQMLQVCNFNFILLPLMLIPKCKIARQYSVFFAMFAASTTMFSIPKSLAVYACGCRPSRHCHADGSKPSASRKKIYSFGKRLRILLFYSGLRYNRSAYGSGSIACRQ